MLKLGVFLVLVFVGVNSYGAKPASEFFEKYISLSDQFDVAVANLYMDSAKISMYRKYPHGLERGMELTGVQWKGMVPKVMPLAKAQKDKSTFSNITISKTEKGYKIKADRYSERKCYKDTGYYMLIEKKGDAGFLIREEYMETQSQSSC